MNINKNVLGIDIGSVSVSMAELDKNRRICSSHYAFHRGNPMEVLSKMLDKINLKNISEIACTSSSPDFVITQHRYDIQVAYIKAAKMLHETVGSLLIVGGEKFSLVQFDTDGNYMSCKTNTSCAAGTGSFLDQQAKRLALVEASRLSKEALKAKGDIPKIASRCSVFAKTDLLHTQQEGYSLEAICKGLCQGLSSSIADTLFSEHDINEPVIFAGGVSLNDAVRKELASITGYNLIVDDHSNIYGALGAALLLMEKANFKHRNLNKAGIIKKRNAQRAYYYEPLKLKLSKYPEFTGISSYEYISKSIKNAQPVEVDIYSHPTESDSLKAFIGIDIGSTSTKAAITEKDGKVIAGFYTRTSGRPLKAVQEIFEAITSWSLEKNINLEICGAGTTGSGRKFAGNIIGADLIIDEITAHAKAACKIDPEIDTIIEIGGQDSKFTTLKNGMVTFSVMNNVCAAGTGSFIEEQATSLGCSLSECSLKASGARAPVASDRCTVFMERDLNHYRNTGYSLKEVMASTLHCVRENYLSKVAGSCKIGNKICFQGATAKNKSLIAAFEQKLKKPIMVSKYCHITGALGLCYLLAENDIKKSSFKGLSLYKKDISIKSSICTICKNHCKIRIADVDGNITAYGFLCGRDYHTRKYVSSNKSGFDLVKSHSKIFDFKLPQKFKYDISVGIPAAIYLLEDLPLWKKFFSHLGINCITSENYKEARSTGKKLARAEFCAPIASFFGHVDYLAKRADYLFIPNYLETRKRKKGAKRQYCYYSQFTSALLPTIERIKLKEKCITPLMFYNESSFSTIVQLYNALKLLPVKDISFFDVSMAYDKALKFFNERKSKLNSIFKKEFNEAGDISVLLLGRPYTVLSPAMNKHIPDIFSSQGIKTFFQDMLPLDECDESDISYLLNAIHWNYTADLIKSAYIVAKTPDLYPVLITSFKCAPDSCTIEYFKRIMDRHDKPYLILQLDEHDSTAGYETRIESAIRSFRNHSRSGEINSKNQILPVNPILTKNLDNKTLLIPNWDSLSCQFIVDNLKREGIDARLLVENELIIQKSLSTNTGQCIPINCITLEFIEYVKENGIKPENAVLWILNSQISCNIGLYPYYMKSLLESYGKGFEKTEVYCGEMSFLDISLRAAINTYFAFMFGGLLRRMACKIRPFEKYQGHTERALKSAKNIFSMTFRGEISKINAVKRAVELFKAVKTIPGEKQKVAIFGDFYVVDNDIMNQQLVHFIEKNNGEVISTPHTEYIKLVAKAIFIAWLHQGKYLDVITNRSILSTLKVMEKKYALEFEKILGPLQVETRSSRSPEEILKLFNLKPLHRGESFDNILKIFHMLEVHPEISLFVQASPAFCCPSLITEAMAKNIEKITGVPIVSITYDGTISPKNEVIIPYLKYPAKRTTGGKWLNEIKSNSDTSLSTTISHSLDASLQKLQSSISNWR